MVNLLKCRAYCLSGFGTDLLGKVHHILSTCRLVEFGHLACLLVASIFVVVLALLDIVCGVHASMFLTERTVLLVHPFLVFLWLRE